MSPALALVLLLQVALPLGAIVGFAAATPRSRAGFWAHAVASVLAVLAAALVGVWTLLPFWLPYVYAVLLLVTGAATYGWRDPPATAWPSTRCARLHLAACAGVGVLALACIALGAAARVAPAEAAALASPLPAGTYLVREGGGTAATNAHRLPWRSTLDVPGTQGAQGEEDAVEFVALNDLGRSTAGLLPRAATAYGIFGRAVRAPCDANVERVLDGVADGPVPAHDQRHPYGNQVWLHCVDGIVLLARLKRGSIEVREGQHVRVGEQVARVGNSGSGAEPTLHVHALRPRSPRHPLDGPPMPVRFDGRYLVRNDRVTVASN